MRRALKFGSLTICSQFRASVALQLHDNLRPTALVAFSSTYTPTLPNAEFHRHPQRLGRDKQRKLQCWNLAFLVDRSLVPSLPTPNTHHWPLEEIVSKNKLLGNAPSQG